MVSLSPRDLIPRSQQEVRGRLATLEEHRNQLRAYGDRMVAEFRERFPDAPAYLTRYADRTNNDFRWRRSAARRWRGEGVRRRNTSIELTGEDGKLLLQWLPEETRRVWIDYERRRIELNLALALTNYERMRLRDYLDRVAVLRRLARESAG